MCDRMKKGKRLFLIALLVVVCLGIWVLWGNAALEVNEFEVESERIPGSLDGFRIAQISDLHNAEFGEGNAKLLELLVRSEPDIIVITGDMIDSRHTDVGIALDFARQAVKIAPVYYVPGNHESRVVEYEALKTGLIDAGVEVMENRKVRIDCEGERITLLGIKDPTFQDEHFPEDEKSIARRAIEELQEESDGYTVLLSHRPELFDLYVDTGMDLVFTGHAHGGQFRLPFIGGIIAPHQGFFPEYDGGQFTEGYTTMMVSRGVGNSIIPVRFNNRPEIVLVSLKCK